MNVVIPLRPTLERIPEGVNRISYYLRAMADDIEAGKWGEITHFATVMKNSEGFLAASPFSAMNDYELLGFLHAVTQRQTERS